MSRFFVAVLFASLLTTSACNLPDSSATHESAHILAETPPSDAGSDIRNGSSQRIAIIDRGLGMTRGTQEIPAGWKLTQDIATNPQNGQMMRDVLEIRGPQGQLIRAIGSTQYAAMFGTRFASALSDLVTQRLGDELAEISLGEPRRSALLENTPEFRKALQYSQQRGMTVQGIELPLHATRRGTLVRGIVYVAHFTFPGGGTIQATAVVSPPELIADAVRIHQQISHSYRANPAFEQRRVQVHEATMARSNAEHRQRMAASRAQHQQRMASNQALFESHQRSMQQRYDAADQQHNQWMNDFRSSGSSAWSGNDYSGHDALIDGIHERSSFDDPYSGQQLSRDGQYDYWYQNNLGEYYGTDDPNVDPYSLPGDWQQIDPLTPNP